MQAHAYTHGIKTTMPPMPVEVAIAVVGATAEYTLNASYHGPNLQQHNSY